MKDEMRVEFVADDWEQKKTNQQSSSSIYKVNGEE
jgi:hypothetical protein